MKAGQRYLRPAEVDPLIGDDAKAKKNLGWEHATRMKALDELITEADLAALKPA